MKIAIATPALLLCLALIGCGSAPQNPNPHADAELPLASLDLPRYMGRWYIIANIPYFAERDFVGSYAQWELRSDGKINDSFYGHKNNFDSALSHYQFLDTVEPGSGNANWTVRPFWPLHFTQLTLYVDPNYQYTILGYPGKRLGWIFSRSPEMSDATYREMLGRLEEMGYDTRRFRRVPQQPAQLGEAGFQAPHAQ